MIKTIENKMSPEAFEHMREKVLRMNTGIDDFIYNEMLNHKKSYDAETGLRDTQYVCRNPELEYRQKSLVTRQGDRVGVEVIYPKVRALDKIGHAILYVHGAAFQRRTSDINLHTAERFTAMTGIPTFVPDYRVGISYTFDQMVSDLVECYLAMMWSSDYMPDHITVVADSSGCTSALFAIKEVAARGVALPKKVILLSPQAFNDVPLQKLENGKQTDIALATNNLFAVGSTVVTKHMGWGKTSRELSTAYIDYSCLKGCEVLIQVGGDEMLYEDSVALHTEMRKYCPCTLEVYERMFHNFQTYYSICEMAHYCWESMVSFILKDNSAGNETIKKLNLA